MKKWIWISLISFVVILLIIGIVAVFFYNRYSSKIGVILELKDEAGELFEQGITGPNGCSTFSSCVKYCTSEKESCMEFCKDNFENELCVLTLASFESGELDLSDYQD